MSKTVEQRLRDALDRGELAGKTWEEVARILGAVNKVLRKIQARSKTGWFR